MLGPAHGHGRVAPGRELDDSSCRLSRTPPSYRASFCTILRLAGLMTICSGSEADEDEEAGLPGEDPVEDRTRAALLTLEGEWDILWVLSTLSHTPIPSVAGVFPELDSPVGPGVQLGLKCQECRTAERPGRLSSLSTGWLGLWRGCRVEWVGPPEGTSRGCSRAP